MNKKLSIETIYIFMREENNQIWPDQFLVTPYRYFSVCFVCTWGGHTTL